MEVCMIKKLSLLILGAFVAPQSIYAMNTNELEQEFANDPFALHQACSEGNLEKVTGLLAAGASADSQDTLGVGWTPLHYAAYNGYTEIGEYLIGRGACVNGTSADGWMPIHRATYNGRRKMVKLLIKQGASPDSKDNGGWTPLHYAASGDYKKIVNFLIECGACIDNQDNEGNTPFHLASYAGHDEVVKLLVCKSFFPLLLRVTQASLQERCLITLLMNLDKVDKVKFVTQLVHHLVVNNDILYILVDHVPLELQQSLVKLLKEHNTQEQQKAQTAMDLILKAHAARHLKKIQDVLQIQNNDHETARDRASKQHHQPIVLLLDSLCHAEDFSQVDEELKQSITATLHHTLSMH